MSYVPVLQEVMIVLIDLWVQNSTQMPKYYRKCWFIYESQQTQYIINNMKFL